MNVLAEEPLILTRLRGRISTAQLKTVASVASVLGTVNVAALLPAAFLQPGSAAVKSASGDGRALLEEPAWTVILCLAHVPDPANLTATYQAAGELMGAIVEALAGWAPSVAYRPTKYTGRGEPEVAPGHIEFPLNFTVRRSLSGAG